MTFIEISAVLLLILANGLLAMSELAVVSSRRSRLQSFVSRGSRRAKIALRLIEDPTTFLSTVQIGITLVGVLAGAFSGATIADRLGARLNDFAWIAPHGNAIAIGIVVVAVTYLTLVAGELIPKRIALHNPERIATAVAPAMQRLSQLARPAVWLLKASTEAVTKRLPLAREASVTEDEVRMLIAEGTRAGVFMAKEREMIDGVLRLADRRVRAITTPRSEVVWLEENASPEDIVRQIQGKRLSRLPVCRETLDNPVGIVHMKDLVQTLLKQEPIVLATTMVPPLVVLESVPVLRLLESFRDEGVHMAIVVDEYGTTEGVVTLADVLEAITGDLPERGQEPEEPGLVRCRDGTWLVDGAYPVDEFEHRVGVLGLRDMGDFDTMAGLMLHEMGRLPGVGEGFELPGGRFEVVDMDVHRIDKIRFVPAQAGDQGASREADQQG